MSRLVLGREAPEENQEEALGQNRTEPTVMKIACPKCRKHLNCPDRLAGKRGSCPKCGAEFRVPSGQPKQPAPQSTQLIAQTPPSPPPQRAPDPEDDKPESSDLFDSKPQRPFLYQDKYVTVWEDGSADFHFKNVQEGKLAVKGLRLARRQLQLHLSSTNTALREVRHQYTDSTRRRMPKFPGGGTFGRLIRLSQTISHDIDQHNLANDIQPLHNQKELMKHLINCIDQHILRIQTLIFASGSEKP
jgi:hypothetical protein